MKYNLKLENISIVEEDILELNIDLEQGNNKSFTNEKNRVYIKASIYLYNQDNGEIKNNNMLKEILNIKDRYIDVELEYNNSKFRFPKMYICSLKQQFKTGLAILYISLTQKFLGKESEIEYAISG